MNALVLHTEQINNVQMSLDHNSQLYSRVWLNQLVPFMAGVAQMSLIDAQKTADDIDGKELSLERINYARSLLTLQSA